MYCLYFDSPSSSLQLNHGYSLLNRINLDMDIKNLFGAQEYYVGLGSGGIQDYYMGQDYSIGHGFAHGFSMGGPSDPVKDDSPIEEVAPVKANKGIGYLIAIVGALSHQIDIGAIGFGHIGISCIKVFSHSASLPAAANATNSDSIVEPVMHVCFLESHEIAPPPSMNTHPLVEAESST
nr:protein sieve element occlusion B-like [Tanacetum cinerariifolium]GEV75112.1 protein sieve element occlusion B-like [Tanacetum cinerariifolium]